MRETGGAPRMRRCVPSLSALSTPLTLGLAPLEVGQLVGDGDADVLLHGAQAGRHAAAAAAAAPAAAVAAAAAAKAAASAAGAAASAAAPSGHERGEA